MTGTGSIRVGRKLLLAALVAATLAGWAGSGPAARTRSFTATIDSLARGQADGVAVSGGGQLFLAPGLVRNEGKGGVMDAAQVWAAVADNAGNVFLGTGPEGRVVKLAPSGETSVVFTTDQPLVTALAITPQGDLLAGTAPGGEVYRIAPDGSGKLWSETGERYVWSLAVSPDGRVFAGTGEQGRILEIHRSGNTSPFFDSDEAHVVSLAALPDGGLLAGGAGRGLVYRVDAEGNALVLYDDELEEVAAVVPAEDGAVVAAFVASPEAEAQRPALRLRLPDGVEVGTTDENVASLEETRGPLLQGYIEGLPGQPEGREPPVRGKLVRIADDGESVELWRSTEERPFALLRAAAGELMFATGEPARVYRVDGDGDGDGALLSTLREAQATALVRVGRIVFLATSNPGAVYRVDPLQSEAGVFLSAPIDAGGLARWGSIRWRSSGDAGRVEIYTRTGNSAAPDATWSAWSPQLRLPQGSAIVNPDARYLQWRARFVGAQSAGVRLSGVTVLYEPHNRPPEIREFRLESDAYAVRGTATLAWSALDPDGDSLDLDVEYRRSGTADWATASTTAGDGDAPPTAGRWQWARRLWDTGEIEEGEYEVRAVASDAPANPPGQGRRVTKDLSRPLIVDRTPPRLSVGSGGGATIEVTVADDLSRVDRLELVRDGRTRYSLRATDGVCDSTRESFRFSPPGQGAGWILRGVDAAGNLSEVPLPGP